jgi:hypothetical protein
MCVYIYIYITFIYLIRNHEVVFISQKVKHLMIIKMRLFPFHFLKKIDLFNNKPYKHLQFIFIKETQYLYIKEDWKALDDQR